ncbi:Auxin responsive SAUR protein [Heracleum sosnowskyi]|uniref:Auxin responsive SAUR protein n=1 Tax=Heracleum sosnowskyi TaxID=360622 RepID=A0AAD8M6K8_9APIA|nr:Auxin responsive SAUR protein [Heracleum sosnowskyi]
MSFHMHLHRGKTDQMKEIPKGRFAIMVGRGEEQQKFIIPVTYISHPLFTELLQEAEEEYGFNHQGVISIPCHVHRFRDVQSLIDKENTQHPNNHHLWCFRAP